MSKVWIRTPGNNAPDVESTIEHAESIHGKRLDRRFNYLVMHGKVHTLARWSDECHNCEGVGCQECGGHGRKRRSFWCEVTT